MSEGLLGARCMIDWTPPFYLLPELGGLFAGTGDVAPTLGKLKLHTIKRSCCFGLRYPFDPVEKMCIRIDFGFGKGTSGMYITANEAI